MNLNVLGYDIIPSLFYIFVFFIFFRLLIIPIKYKRGKNTIAITISGFFGFFLFTPIVFYDELHQSYFLVPIGFFVLCTIGIIGCLKENVNPLFPKDILFNVYDYEEAQAEKENVEKLPEVINQTKKESLKMINRELLKLNAPFNFYKNVEIRSSSERLGYHFIVTGPSGVFNIYPCNWNGDITFTNTGGTYDKETAHDTKNYVISSTYHKQLLDKVIHSVGMEKAEVTTLIVCTNPTSNIHGFPDNYEAVPVDKLINYIENFQEVGLSSSEMYDVQTAIDDQIIKK